MKNKAFLSLGTNMGDREDNLTKALNLLKKHPNIKVVNVSSIYETDPVGYENQADFLNIVVEIKTDVNAIELLNISQEIEEQLGRKREIRWGPRIIDLDILLYNDENIETEHLTIPHPRMFERGFVMVPLIEIYPGILEDKNRSIKDLTGQKGVRLWKQKIGEEELELFES